MLVRKDCIVRPQRVTDSAEEATIGPVAVNTRTLVLSPEIAAAVAAIPVTAERGVPETKLRGNVTVIMSEFTRAVVNVNPITILRFPAATRSAGAMVSKGEVTAPPMLPVGEPRLWQSRDVSTVKELELAMGEPRVPNCIAVNVSV